jgi:hypothetical protein
MHIDASSAHTKGYEEFFQQHKVYGGENVARSHLCMYVQ